MCGRHLLFVLLFLSGALQAQDNVPVNGLRDRTGTVHAFIHATVHPAPDREVQDGTVLVRDGRIVAVGTDVDVPPDAVIHDLKGRHLWPGLVEPVSELGLKGWDRKDRERHPTGPHFWNPAIHAAYDAVSDIDPVEKDLETMRAMGFGTALVHRRDGIARGSGCAVLLAGRSQREDVLLERATTHFSFRKGSSPEPYPGSLTGSIALLRQALYDARWYAQAGKDRQRDLDLEALSRLSATPLFFEAHDREDLHRIGDLASEFGMRFAVHASGTEYARADAAAAMGMPLVLPLDLPEAYDVEDPFDALEVSLADLKHWELAPHGPRILVEAGCTIAFTADGLKKPEALWAALRRVVRCGLDTATALAALTTVPAQLMGLEGTVGTLEPGARANLLVTTGHLLDPENTLLENWVDGQPFILKHLPEADLTGVYDLNLRAAILKLNVSGDPAKLKATVTKAGDSTHTKADLELRGPVLTLTFDGTDFGLHGTVRLNGVVHREGAIWDGQGQLPDGEWTAWSAVRQVDERIPATDRRKPGSGERLDSLFAAPPGAVWYPLGAYGAPDVPAPNTLVFRHATVWTNGPDGTLRDADVLVHEGRITAVGRGLDPALFFTGKKRPAVTEIDATGRHLTCGIIDEHSHIAISRGVNEGGQASSAEVRMGDVVDPDDVSIYRDLAGGVTAAQLLHGSANPIGGQSALIKLRWGSPADSLLIDGADGFIKFALGENVKQSNWGNVTGRFPQTRMGVEQFYYEAFHRARAYDREWRLWRSLKPKEREATPAPRRDLDLEALAEILNGERFITCHSYVQSEVDMLMHVADSMGFTVNTFTHILEGYKVAPKMQEHGSSASTFSDWWAYKYEVRDAIPYNAALLWEQGVNTGINSDDAEMSRRLNQEAAKAVKYGGVPPEEAWKMVTLNPARMLHLDHRMGSVEPGKDADLVLWDGNPLAISSRVLMTLVDGAVLYDQDRDARLRKAMMVERERLVHKMIAAKQAGASTRKAGHAEKGFWHCDSEGEMP